MEKLSGILIAIGIVVLVFSVWSFLIVKKHVSKFNNNYRHNSALTDERYFELKSRQDYIISSSTVIFGILAFLGFSSINDIKVEMSKQLEMEKHKLDSLNTSANKDYLNLELRGSNYKDSVDHALQLLSALKSRMYQISNKDIIKQNIYIVDPLVMGNFPKDKNDPNRQFRIVKFADLETISGQKLPGFKTTPSIICFSSTHATLLIKDVTKESFKIQPESYYPTGKNDLFGDSVQFSVWISQKPLPGSFSNDFSKDFK